MHPGAYEQRYDDEFLQPRIDSRSAVHAARSLMPVGTLTDLSSNDYLGIVRNSLMNHAPLAAGSTGSRLISGNHRWFEQAEDAIAAFHEAEAALVFNSGYDANLGLLSALAGRTDNVFYDALSHASIRDGIRLSNAVAYSFRHNDPGDLAEKISRAKQKRTGNFFVVTESVFSMDGDMAPLEDLLNVCQREGAHLVLDEAHAIGVIGNRGEGLAQALELHQRVFCRLYTFGKACGCHGAAVAGSGRLREFLVNFARSFVYTTALPPESVAAIRSSYEIFPALVAERKALFSLVEHWRSLDIPQERIASESAIQPVVIQGNSEVRAIAKKIREAGLDVRAILSPTVPRGAERLRVVLHSYNTKDELDSLATLLRKVSD